MKKYIDANLVRQRIIYLLSYRPISFNNFLENNIFYKHGIKRHTYKEISITTFVYKISMCQQKSLLLVIGNTFGTVIALFRKLGIWKKCTTSVLDFANRKHLITPLLFTEFNESFTG